MPKKKRGAHGRKKRSRGGTRKHKAHNVQHQPTTNLYSASSNSFNGVFEECSCDECRGVSTARYSEVTDQRYSEVTEQRDSGVTDRRYSGVTDRRYSGVTDRRYSGVTDRRYSGVTDQRYSEVTEQRDSEVTEINSEVTEQRYSEVTEQSDSEVTEQRYSEVTEQRDSEVTEINSEVTEQRYSEVTEQSDSEVTEQRYSEVTEQRDSLTETDSEGTELRSPAEEEEITYIEDNRVCCVSRSYDGVNDNVFALLSERVASVEKDLKSLLREVMDIKGTVKDVVRPSANREQITDVGVMWASGEGGERREKDKGAVGGGKGNEEWRIGGPTALAGDADGLNSAQPGNADVGHQNGLRDVGNMMTGQENGEGDRAAALKRSVSGDVELPDAQNEPAIKRRKTGPPQPKNPISTLNELRPGLIYKTLGMEGPSHAPVFTVTVELNGQVFQGSGRSKKLAKHSAAEAALRSFLQFRNASDAAEALGTNITAVQDFTSDVSEPGFGTNSAVGETTPSRTTTITMDSSPVSTSPTSTTAPSGPSQTSKNPIMLLNELRQGVEYTLKQESGEPHAKTFTFQVTVEGQLFEGTGNSKKLAKAAAARQALSKLYGVISTPTAVLHHTPISNMPNIHMPQTLADRVAKMVCDKFSELTSGNPTLAKRKVLAGIVLTNEKDMEDMKVISVATGTKCINGEHLSLQGQCINDCHAEIVARSTAETIFEQLEDQKGFRVCPEYKFHLYINTAPCGDARIFAPHEEEVDRTDRHPNRQSRGLLRTKIESGEGTIPIKANADNIQTWDGVLQGERLRTMSCSDKIARWNIVGLQGSLLSHFLEPIYLESIVLGSLFSASHMYRAVCGRIEQSVQGLPPPFKLNQPKMNQGSSTESRQPQKAPTISVNWDCEGNQLEVLNAMTGRQEGENYSRLCKRRFLSKFIDLLDGLPTLTEVDPGAAKCLSYGEIKALATNYQTSKRAVASAFSRAGLGQWISKPMEEDSFYM
ncbi:Double-stranded RNA-specific editase 1-like 2 [Homarus americanus]|uniref:Double-stranded RNA-specific editase 1-like 2 n=1 Tax=Homarus americanus TaxID=6706 RepID=A0A8J5KNW8_HOMAM|nr:Double-stranded RNA-specific editase 1-like 2 [Homarus americanus]